MYVIYNVMYLCMCVCMYVWVYVCMYISSSFHPPFLGTTTEQQKAVTVVAPFY